MKVRITGGLPVTDTDVNDRSTNVNNYCMNHISSGDSTLDLGVPGTERKKYNLFDIRRYLQSAALPANIGKSKYSLVRSSKSFTLHDKDRDRMFFKHCTNGKTNLREVVFSEVKKMEIFTAVHTRRGHLGISKTVEIICARFFWVGVCKFVRDNIRKCVECQMSAKHNVHRPVNKSLGLPPCQFSDERHPLNDVKEYLRSGSTRPELSRQSKHSLIRSSRRFVLLDTDPDRMFFKQETSEGTSLKEVLFTEDHKLEVFEEAHTRGGHVGRNRTLQRIGEHFFFRDMMRFVVSNIEKCAECQEKMRTRMSSMSCLDTMRGTERWQVVALNTLGPYSETANNNRFMVTLIDTWSQYVDMFAVHDKSVEAVCRCLLDSFYVYGPPAKLLTSLGDDFCASVGSFMFSMFSVAEMVTNKYRPASVSRTGPSVRKLVTAMVTERPNNWDDPLYMKQCLFEFRCRVNTTIGLAPFFVMFGREAATQNTNEDQDNTIESAS